MKTDLYTKIVLTVIAVVLTINLVRDFAFVTPAQANTVSNLVNETKNTGSDGVMDVNIVQLNGSRVSSSGMPAEIKNGEVPVDIKRFGGWSIGSSGIPVEVKNYRDFK